MMTSTGTVKLKHRWDGVMTSTGTVKLKHRWKVFTGDGRPGVGETRTNLREGRRPLPHGVPHELRAEG